ncbi:amidohydrolase [Bacillus tianshenii]|nr:amidohydrolase [Bacillus tianshenii]
MEISKIVNDYLGEIINFRRDLHAHPELSMKEYRTSKKVAEELKKLGLEVQENVGGTGVVGILEGGKPGETLGLRADMDALPIVEQTGLSFESQHEGVMHACGHDVHTSILLGTAVILSKFRADIEGTIKFIFQPGEERMKGARSMIEAGVLKNPDVDAIVCLHCWPELEAGKVGLRKGAIMAASDYFDITIQGQGGHAAYPHKCVDPMIIAARIIDSLQTIVSRELPPYESAVVTIGKIAGGSSYNIIAPEVTMGGTVRTTSKEIQQQMPEVIERIITNIANAHRGTAELTYHKGTPPLINNIELVNTFERSATVALGGKNVTYLPNPAMGGEDFSFYLQHVPGMLFRLGTNNEDERSQYPLHHPSLIFDEKAISAGIKVMSRFALDYLKH